MGSHLGAKRNFRDVVLVADVFEECISSAPIHERRDLEMTDTRTLDILKQAILSLGLEVHHYRGADELARCADKHLDDIVLAIYGGQCSRNRMALVPAVCEAFKLRYVGPDVYGRIVAQDKELSKRLALECGLATPPWRVIRKAEDLRYATGVNTPVVVKPLFEGSSIGISQRNLVVAHDSVVSITEEVLARFEQPVLVEEFISGREVAFTKIQTSGEAAWAYSEIVMTDDPNYFVNRLFDAQEKQVRSPQRTVRNIDAELNREDHKRLEVFLETFGRFGYCRVDGRHKNGRFVFLELTPDAWIGPRGQFAMSFTEKGWAYQEVIASVLASAS